MELNEFLDTLCSDYDTDFDLGSNNAIENIYTVIDENTEVIIAYIEDAMAKLTCEDEWDCGEFAVYSTVLDFLNS